MNMQDIYGSTPLHLAAYQGHLAYVKALLKVPGIDPNLTDIWGRTSLEHACRQGQTEIVACLVLSEGIQLDLKNKRGETPLLKCCSYDHATCAEALLRAGAKPDVQDGLYHNTALLKSASRGFAGCVQLLLNYGANLTITNSGGCNALHLGVIAESIDVCRVLFDWLADHPEARPCLEQENKRGLTPLGEAKRSEKQSLLDFFLQLTKAQGLEKLLAKPVGEWVPDEVGRWIELIGYRQYSDAFRRHDVSGALLTKLTDDLMRHHLEVHSWGARVGILESLDELLGRKARTSESRTQSAQQSQAAQASTSTAHREISSQLPSSRTIDWDGLDIHEELGRGFFGSVRRATWCGIAVAVKTVYRTTFRNHTDLELFRREVDILGRLQHPNIVMFLGVSESPEGEKTLVTEYVSRGSLKKLIRDEPDYLGECSSRRFNIASGIANGMVYLHHNTPPIMHRDLTTSNILVNSDGTVKICDFGMSKFFVDDQSQLSQAVGCMTSMAPEVYRGEPYSPSVDVFGFAMVMYELFTGRTPNGGLEQRKYTHKVAYENYRPALPDSIPPWWQCLIQSCWDERPDARPTFMSIQQQLKNLESPASAASSSSLSAVDVIPSSGSGDSSDSFFKGYAAEGRYCTGSGSLEFPQQNTSSDDFNEGYNEDIPTT